MPADTVATIPTLDCGDGHFLALDLPNGAAHFVCPTLGVLVELEAAEFPKLATVKCRCGCALSATKPGKPAAPTAPYALTGGQNQQ